MRTIKKEEWRDEGRESVSRTYSYSIDITFMTHKSLGTFACTNIPELQKIKNKNTKNKLNNNNNVYIYMYMYIYALLYVHTCTIIQYNMYLGRSITGSRDEEVLIWSKGEAHDITSMTSE